jgi:hypothetical protein
MKSIIFLLLALFVVETIVADTLETPHDALRCGSNLVSVGDSRYEVRGKCGAPADVVTWEEDRTQRDFRPPREWDPERGPLLPFLATERVLVEKWTYDFGPTRFLYLLTFENGRLVRIVTRGYGG